MKILVRGTDFFMENWSYPENFGPTMDQFSMEFWSGGPSFSGKIGQGTIFFREYWSGDHFFQGKLVIWGPFFSGKIGPGRPFFSGNIGPGGPFFQGILARETNSFMEN